MSSLPQTRPIVRFGTFELDVRSGELRKQGLKTRLTPQAFQVLLILLENRGELVTRDALRQRLWPADTFVDFDMGLASAVKKLREALGDSAENPRFVETLPRRGYRFIGAVDPGAVVGPAPALAPETAPTPPPAPARSRGVLVAMAAVVGAALLALLLLAGRHWPVRATSGPAVRSIAVLPLENLSGDASQDYFADGMTDALITDLAQAGDLQVTSRTSVTQYKRTRKAVPVIAQELGVDAVVEGTVVRVGQRVRVTAQLVHGPTDRHLWAHSYERELRDVLALQADIAAAIAQAVEAQVRPGEHRRRAGAVDPEAYESYLKGRFYGAASTNESLLKAVDHFQAAIDKDPSYAPAWSGLSDSYRIFDLRGLMPPREGMPRAEAAAHKALALDDTLAEAHSSLAAVRFRYDWDWAGSEKEFQRALKLDPSYAEGHRAYAVYLIVVGRPGQAVAEAQRARDLSPLSPAINTELGLALSSAGRMDEAVAQLRKTMQMDPGFGRVYQSLAMACRRKGDAAGEADAVEKGLAQVGPRGRSNWLAYFCGLTGRRQEALDTLADLEKRSAREYVSPQSMAVVWLGLGEKQRALALLDKAADERAIEWLGFATEVTDRLRGEPRFQALRRRLGLPPSP